MQRSVDGDTIENLVVKLKKLKKEIEDLEEDKRKLSIFNAYAGR